MQDDVQRVLIDRQAIAQRVASMAQAITRDFGLWTQAAEPGTRGQPPSLVLVPILTGSLIFVADLIRCLPLPLRLGLISVTSYPGALTQSKGAALQQELGAWGHTLAGAHVLVVDDILDSGQTLTLALSILRQRRPATLRSCVLLRKPRPQTLEFPIDYVGFDIPDEFVVGYGLDFDDYYRNLPDIVTLRPHVIEQARRRSRSQA